MNGQPEPAPAGDSKAETRTRWVIAAFIVVVYVAVRIWLLIVANDEPDESVWGRYTFLAGGFDSLVAVVIGWMFGREVHRKAYEAEFRAAKHSREAERQAREAEATSHRWAAGAREAHIEAMKKSARAEGFARAVKAIFSAVPDTANGQPDAQRAEAAPVAPTSDHPSLQRVVEQIGQAINEFFPERGSDSGG